jgi:transcriptional regulator with XRE-family HTH domain
MSPQPFLIPQPRATADAVASFWLAIGVRLRDARIRRQLTVAALARMAGTSRSLAYAAEAGEATSVEAVIRLGRALGLRLETDLVDPRQRRQPIAAESADVVHSAMGELEARHLRRYGFELGIDEPYQHYQFAGRADVVAWDLERRALLHIENRTRFPDLQQAAGSYNAKRAYLADALASRLGIRRWASQAHVVAGVWSSEVLHVIRLRRETFRALCPDGSASFEGWWRGSPPTSGTSSTLIVLDPLARPRQRPFVGLDAALTARSRYRGYAEVAERLRRGE